MDSLQKGDEAPEFTLISSDKEELKLSDLKGNPAVLLFFPLAFTGVCTTELCAVRDDISFYDRLDARVLGISVDSPFALEKYKSEQRLNFTLLSDFNKEASKAYGAYYDEFAFGLKGVSKRAAFVVDAGGVIQYAEVLDNAGELPNFDAIQDTLKRIS